MYIWERVPPDVLFWCFFLIVLFCAFLICGISAVIQDRRNDQELRRQREKIEANRQRREELDVISKRNNVRVIPDRYRWGNYGNSPPPVDAVKPPPPPSGLPGLKVVLVMDDRNERRLLEMIRERQEAAETKDGGNDDNSDNGGDNDN